MSMNPTNPTEGADGLYALLAVIADPAKHKARLDELVAQGQANKDQIDALDAMAADTRRLNSTAQASNIVLENRKAALDAREGEIGERAKQADLAAAEVLRQARLTANRETALKADMEAREAAVKAREIDVTERETLVEQLHDEGQSLKAEYEQKVAALKAAVG